MNNQRARHAGVGRYAPWSMVINLWQQRHLTRQLVRREIEGRYRGSMLGMFWSLATPLVMLGVYTFVFGVVFRSRWPNQPEADSLLGFAVVLFAGTTVFNIFSETVARAPGLIVSNPGYVKKVIFPLEILPFSILGAALFNAAIGVVLLIVMSGIMHGGVPWTVVLIPVVIVPVVLFSLGIAWFLASLGVYIRDVSNLIGVALQVLFFATPIFYPITVVPESVRWLLYLNPLTHMIEMFRSVCLFGVIPDPFVMLGSLVCGIITAWLGHVWFNLTRNGFADVI